VQPRLQHKKLSCNLQLNIVATPLAVEKDLVKTPLATEENHLQYRMQLKNHI
jgi:hypothetical protein